MVLSRQDASCLRIALNTEGVREGKWAARGLSQSGDSRTRSPCDLLSLLHLPSKSEGEEAAGKADDRRSQLYIATRVKNCALRETEKDAAGDTLAKGGAR